MNAIVKIVSGCAMTLVLSAGPAAAQAQYEVWAIDQSNSAGRTFGGTLYIYDGKELERGHRAAEATPEKIDLGGAAAAMCLAKTGVNPVRPHMLAVNASQTHAIVSFVASGHVLIMDARTRTPIDCIRTSVGAGGARQVHFAIPSPDETYIAVANQNGKLFERIDTAYSSNSFVLNPRATVDLVACTTPNGVACEVADIRPDNAPICPIIEATSRYVFVTLRGGGLFVMDAKATPMQIVAEYDIHTVHPNGCLGAQVGAKMYVDSGGGTAAHLFGADIYAFPVTGFSPLNPPNVPKPTVVLSDTSPEADAHGATLTNHQRYLWVADRGRNFIWAIDTQTDQIVNVIQLAGAVSDDPDARSAGHLAERQPRLHVASRPEPCSPPILMSALEARPGVGVIKVLESGRGGLFEALAPATNVDAAGVERADVHALTIRLKRTR